MIIFFFFCHRSSLSTANLHTINATTAMTTHSTIVTIQTKLLLLRFYLNIYHLCDWTYFQLLNRTNFALHCVILFNWAFILWVVDQLCLHDPLTGIEYIRPVVRCREKKKNRQKFRYERGR